jgi:hypothetical protein
VRAIHRDCSPALVELATRAAFPWITSRPAYRAARRRKDTNNPRLPKGSRLRENGSAAAALAHSPALSLRRSSSSSALPSRGPKEVVPTIAPQRSVARSVQSGRSATLQAPAESALSPLGGSKGSRSLGRRLAIRVDRSLPRTGPVVAIVAAATLGGCEFSGSIMSRSQPCASSASGRR